MQWTRDKATLDPEQADVSTRGSPGAIGMLKAGVFVLDLDRKNGVDGVDWYQRNIGEIPVCASVETPRNGIHIWFSRSDFSARSSSDAIHPGVDVVGASGAAVVPLSRTRNGVYRPVAEVFTFAKPPSSLMAALTRVNRPTLVSKRTQAEKIRNPSAWSQATLKAFAKQLRESRYPETELNRLSFLVGARPAIDESDALGMLVETAVSMGVSYGRAVSIFARAVEAGRRTVRG